MKMVKSLLLGSAAGLVAIAGAQAADLPVKAKPVQYVKICSLYGAGFYYVPGTDMCLKIGGWVRLYTIWGGNTDSTNAALDNNNRNNRTTGNFSWKERGYITADARNQTEYGTIRSYLDVGFTGDDAIAFSSNRAFIQFAGFTFGLSQSFYDFYSQAAVSYWGGRITPNSDTGDAGQTVWAYTAQFGNGLSATLSAEAPLANHRTFVWNTSHGAQWNGTANPANSYIGPQWPDFVGNLRIDQAWGAAQIMGAIHDTSATYYNPANETSGHPDNKVGWAVGAGLKLNAPMIGKGDYFQTQFNYSQGATAFVAVPAAGGVSWGQYNGGTYGYGLQSDGVYGPTGSSVELTTAWGVAASYEHFWNPHWQTSVYGSYVQIEYNDTANVLACTAVGAPALVAGTCDNNFSYWDIGTRTNFNLDSQTYVGLDIVYQHLNTASDGAVYTLAATNGKPAGNYQISDQSAWVGQFRVHRNFYP